MNRHLFFILFLFLTSCCPVRFLPKNPPDPLPSCNLPNKPKIALVLGSGGVRGMAHVGVIEELEKAGIRPDVIIGCSAGSIVGALYADNPNIEALKHSTCHMRTSSIVDIDLINCRFGLCQSASMTKALRKHLHSSTFEELQIPLVVVATDLHTGELVPFGGGCLIKAVQASCSIPFVFVPCQHYGRILVDGGVIDPVPIKVAKDLGAEVIIAVDLSETLPKTFPTNLFGVATRSTEIAYMWLNDNCIQGADVLIKPKMGSVGTFNDKERIKLYWAGREATLPLIPQILEAIEDTNSCEISEFKEVHLSPYNPLSTR